MNSFEYADKRRSLLIELRIMRRTKPAKRVVKHMQVLMKRLRSVRQQSICR